MHTGTPSADGIREGTSSTILHRKPYRGEHHRSHPRPSIRRMTATFQGVNITLHGFLDFARAENENPTGPDIQIVLGRPLDIASQNPVSPYWSRNDPIYQVIFSTVLVPYKMHAES